MFQGSFYGVSGMLLEKSTVAHRCLKVVFKDVYKDLMGVLRMFNG